MRKKVIVTAKAHEVLLDQLQQRGYTVEYVPQITYEQLKEKLDDVEGLVITTRIPLDKAIIDRATSLKWVGRLGSGMELIDIEYAKSKGIKCISTPEGNRNAVAEHVLGVLLNLLNHITASQLEIRQGKWLRLENIGTELSGKTVGIIGFGNTGSTLAHLLRPFDVTVLAFDKYKFGFAKDYIKEASLKQLCRYADVISFHVPLTEETRSMGNEQFFNALERKPWILNASRGKVINIHHLLQALKWNQIAGAGLDVLENEKLESYTPEEQKVFNELLAFPNVVITPHIAGYTHEAFLKMGQVLIEKLFS
jgi:D-3-phosphoglycerate dehydrogenase / 2-oxoglutarate reductase